MTDPGNVKPGDEIRAEHINFLRDLVAMLGLGVSGPMASMSGIAVPLVQSGFYIKLTSIAGSSYAWTEQISTGAGAWAAGSRSGTTSADPALEINGNALTIPGGGLVVKAWRSEGGAMLFQFGAC